MALQKTLLKKRLRYRHPLTPKTSFCDKTIGSRALIFVTITIKKCMNNLEFFQPNLRRSSREISLNWYVWRGIALPQGSPTFFSPRTPWLRETLSRDPHPRRPKFRPDIHIFDLELSV